jgi:hypothetical protein
VTIGAVRSGSPATDIYWRDAGGAHESALLKNGLDKRPSDWSHDGRYLLYTEVDPRTGADIWVLPNPSDPSAGHDPFPFARTSSMESEGQLSPDGHWIASRQTKRARQRCRSPVSPAMARDGFDGWRNKHAGGAMEKSCFLAGAALFVSS